MNLVITEEDIRSLCSALDYQSWNDRELSKEESDRIEKLVSTLNALAKNTSK